MLLAFLLVIIIIFCALCPYRQESYVNSPLLVYDVEINNSKIYVEQNVDTDSSDFELLRSTKNIEVVSSLGRVYDERSVMHAVNIYDYIKNFEKHVRNKVFTILPTKRVFLFIKAKNNISDEQIANVLDTSMIIGYKHEYQIDIVKFICKSLNLDVTKLRFKKVEDFIANQQFFSSSDVYCMFVETAMSNEIFLKGGVDPQFKIDFVLYDKFDINIIKYYLPYVVPDNIDLRLYFMNYTQTFSIKTLLTIDVLLYGDKSMETRPELSTALFTLDVNYENFDVINYYTIFFDFFEQTMNYIRAKNQHIIERTSLPILEQFGEEYFEISASGNVDGYSDKIHHSLVLSDNFIDNIPLTVGNRVILKFQTRPEENGDWFVKSVDIDNKTATLSNLLRLHGTYVVTNNKLYFDIVPFYLDGIPLKKIKKKDDIYLVDMQRYGNLNYDVTHTPYIQIRDDAETGYEPGWKCYDHPEIQIKGLCESDYDMDGILKPKETYWDRECKTNSDCPYYQSNTNYKNYHGGCFDGFCEFPVGMSNVSYRKGDGTPFCYNCVDSIDGNCCEDQKDKTKYPNILSPDYAFDLDSMERHSQIRSNMNVSWF